MTRVRRWVAPAFALGLWALLYGCSSGLVKTPPPPDLDCTSAEQCVVQVQIDCGHSPCTIGVSKQNVAAHGFAVVWWIVDKPGQSYQFRNPGGVYFKSAGVQRGFDCHPEANGKRYRCRGDRDGKTYEYGIDLVGTPAVRILDPWIVNN